MMRMVQSKSLRSALILKQIAPLRIASQTNWQIAAFSIDVEATCCVLHRFWGNIAALCLDSGAKLPRSASILKHIATFCIDFEAHCYVLHRHVLKSLLT